MDYKNWKPLPASIQFTGFPTADGDAPADAGKSYLVAWDPVKQRPPWQQPTPGPHNGGTLATAGDLVFQGQADGYINAYDAAGGRKLWSFYAATAALGTPITFAVGKTQYVAILTGPLHGAPGGFGSMAARFGWDSRIHPRRLLAFTLDGTAKLPPTPPPVFAQPLDGTDMTVDTALVQEGIQQWSRCQLCHGPGAVAGGTAPDLRASQLVLNPAQFSITVQYRHRGARNAEIRGAHGSRARFAAALHPLSRAARHAAEWRGATVVAARLRSRRSPRNRPSRSGRRDRSNPPDRRRRNERAAQEL